MSDTANLLGTGLLYEDRLPLHWQPTAAVVAEGGSSHVDEANAEFLRIMAALEEHPPEPTEERPEIAHEMRRLESKVDLLLSMVGRLLVRQRPLPEAAPLRLSATGIEWLASSQAPATGEYVLLDLYLCRDFPLPLLLTGKVAQVTEEPAGGRRTTVIFEGLGGTVRDWLDKIVFRQHRRRVAHSRREATKEA